MVTSILIILLALFFSAFFSGVEIAFVSANRLKMELVKQQNTLSGRILTRLTHHYDQLMATLLIGNNIALVILGLFSAKLFTEMLPPMSDFWMLLIQTLATTIVVLIAGEFLPKILFRLKANDLLNILAAPIQLIYYLLYVIAWPITQLTKGLLKGMFGMDGTPTRQVFTKTDLEHFIKQFISDDEEEEELNTDIFERALALTEVKARECMVPRMEIVAVEVNVGIEELTKVMIETKLSKILVYEETIDNILGYIHHFDLLKKPAAIRDIIFPVQVIPETMPAKDVMNQFIKAHKSIAVVVDEFGGTAGIVTLEDVLEEIFGDIQDEHDAQEFVEEQLSEHEYIFSGRLEVDHLEETYGLSFPDGDYETLSGFIVVNHESIPDMDDEIEIAGFKFSILSTADTRIEMVKLTVLQDGEGLTS